MYYENYSDAPNRTSPSSSDSDSSTSGTKVQAVSDHGILEAIDVVAKARLWEEDSMLWTTTEEEPKPDDDDDDDDGA